MATTELKTDSAPGAHIEEAVPFTLRAELRELLDSDFEVVLKAVISEHLKRNKSPLQDGFGVWTGA